MSIKKTFFNKKEIVEIYYQIEILLNISQKANSILSYNVIINSLRQNWSYQKTYWYYWGWYLKQQLFLWIKGVRQRECKLSIERKLSLSKRLIFCFKICFFEIEHLPFRELRLKSVLKKSYESSIKDIDSLNNKWKMRD